MNSDKALKVSSAKAFQMARVATELANHVERIEWLSGKNPCWADGEAVDANTRNSMLTQSKIAVEDARRQA